MGSTGPQVVDRELTCPAMEELMTTTGPSHSLEDSVGNEYPYDLGEYARPVTTAVAAAGTWVNRGLVWTFGFNHEEAVECFQRAIDLDPDCALAHWGIAFALGHFQRNRLAGEFVMREQAIERAFEIAAIMRDRVGEKFEHRERHLEALMNLPQ